MSFTYKTKLCLAALAPLVMLTACPNPEGKFDDFARRDCEIQGGTFDDALGGATNTTRCSGIDGDGGSGGASACPLPAEAEADGVYMFALSSTLDRPKAFALDATVVTHIDGDALTLDLSLQPLSKEDQMTPVGDSIEFPGLEVNADGTFDWDLGEVTLVSEGNPISASEVISTLALHGSLCGGEENLGFICGDVTGIVVSPISGYDLVDSTFAMLRYDGDKPAPVINCAKDPAVY